MEVGKAGFEWMDRAKFTKVGGKWKRKKCSVKGLRRGGCEEWERGKDGAEETCGRHITI